MAYTAWDRAWLEHQGFTGFVPFAALPASDVPAGPGVYVVYRGSTAPPRFVEVGSGGRFKGRDPNVTGDRLAAAWVVGAHVVYIGKATAGTGRGRGLRT